LSTVERCQRHERGLTLSHLESGPADAPVIIGLHGFLDTAASFVPLMEALSDRWRWVVPDQRGHGESDRIGDGGYYHFPDYALDLDGLYRHLGIETAILVGHSMGSAIACYFGGGWPERVRGMALLDGIGPPFDTPIASGPGRLRGWVQDVRRRDGHEARPVPNVAHAAASIGKMSTRASEDHLLSLAEAATIERDGEVYWRFDPLHRTSGPIPFVAARFLPFLSAITSPVHLIWAEETGMHAADEAERITALGDVTSETIPDTGHNLHHERPDAVATALRAFLERLDG
jgi:pimeloyl-ACP methyl ester carboxylesterase